MNHDSQYNVPFTTVTGEPSVAWNTPVPCAAAKLTTAWTPSRLRGLRPRHPYFVRIDAEPHPGSLSGCRPAFFVCAFRTATSPDKSAVNCHAAVRPALEKSAVVAADARRSKTAIQPIPVMSKR